MTAYKAKVKAVYPAAVCRLWDGVWCVFTGAGQLCVGFGKTAFLAWANAWRQIEKGRGGE